VPVAGWNCSRKKKFYAEVPVTEQFSGKNKKSGQNQFGERIIDIEGLCFLKQFPETHVMKMLIGGQGRLDFEFLHYHEARAIGKRKSLV
jgi:hypothetical protein